MNLEILDAFDLRGLRCSLTATDCSPQACCSREWRISLLSSSHISLYANGLNGPFGMDVILWRALKHVERGVYVDVGAQDPYVDSVSLAFYEHGWRGLHVDASPYYADLLRKARPDEIVIEAVIGGSEGSITFFEFPNTGLGTGNQSIAELNEAQGYSAERLEVSCRTLDDVLAQLAGGDIHWLKIDVEGMEADVIASWRSDVRPWVLVVEATLPNTQTPNHDAWEKNLLSRGYAFVYFDGLNRFYVHNSHRELEVYFGAGPNYFDNFHLSGSSTAPFCAGLIASLNALGSEVTARRATIDVLERDVQNYRILRERAEAEHEQLRLELLPQIASLQQRVDDLTTSTSWRVTSPLRSLLHVYHHIRFGARAWIRLAPGSRPHRVLLHPMRALYRTPRARAVVRALLNRSPALRARLEPFWLRYRLRLLGGGAVTSNDAFLTQSVANSLRLDIRHYSTRTRWIAKGLASTVDKEIN